MSHNGQHAKAPAGRPPRTQTIVLVVAVGIVALAIGIFLGTRSGDETPVASVTPTVSTDPPATDEPTATATATATDEPSPTPTDGAVPAELDEGRHFVLADEVADVGGRDALVLDLAYFLTGDVANEAAAEDGVETPVPDGYYIVNDNPKLRTVPISDDATVRYIPADPCCDLQPWDLDAWKDAVNGEVMTDMMGEMTTTWWWVTVRNGEIVAIEQQFLP